MPLPYDVARCEGVPAKENICTTCRRAKDGDRTRQWYITPMAYSGHCHNYIQPKIVEATNG